MKYSSVILINSTGPSSNLTKNSEQNAFRENRKIVENSRFPSLQRNFLLSMENEKENLISKDPQPEESDAIEDRAVSRLTPRKKLVALSIFIGSFAALASLSIISPFFPNEVSTVPQNISLFWC